MREAVTLNEAEAHVVARAYATAIILLEKRQQRWPSVDDRRALDALLQKLVGPPARQMLPHLRYDR